MRRVVWIGAGLVAIVIAAVLVCVRSDHTGSRTPSATVAPALAIAKRRADPHTLARASIEGTIRDSNGTPLAGAHACTGFASPAIAARLARERRCAVSDARGAYRFDGLLAARYWVDASAPHHIPAPYRGGTRRSEAASPLIRPTYWFPLAAGEHKTGVDVTLTGGGIAITGTVSDVGGGPIANARVRGGELYGSDDSTTSDTQGRFTLWVGPGYVRVHAAADGYARDHADIEPPGTVDLKLTPESSISGIVVDEAGAPRADVRVVAVAMGLDDLSDITDADGRFRIDQLVPRRYELDATTTDGYGHAPSVLVGLAQHVSGAVVTLHRAYRLEGTVTIDGAGPCKAAAGTLAGAWSENADGVVTFAGLLPGTYRPYLDCPDHVIDEAAEVTIVDRDVTGLVWKAMPGGRVHGRVRTQRGEPLAAAGVYAQPMERAPRAQSQRQPVAHARTSDDGEFTIGGLRSGRYTLVVDSDRAQSQRHEITVTAGATSEQDLVVDEAGAIAGSVVDETGHAVPSVDVVVELAKATPTWATRSVVLPDTGESSSPWTRARGDGSFRIGGLDPGDYRIYAMQAKPLRKPGARDRDLLGEAVRVELGRPATVRIVVELQAAAIAGTVVDATGRPIGDAYVHATREGDRGGEAEADPYLEFRPGGDLTASDGMFRVENLSTGVYTVRALRRGGGDAIATHVAAGATVRLQILPTGSLEGTVRRRDGTAVDDFHVLAYAASERRARRERMYRTDGHFAITDLPAGTYEVTIDGRRQEAQTVRIAGGERRTGVDFVLAPVVVVKGRLVNAQTRKPVGGVRMSAESQLATSDADGRFTLRDIHPGPLQLRVLGSGIIERTIGPDASGMVDLGDVPVARAP